MATKRKSVTDASRAQVVHWMLMQTLVIVRLSMSLWRTSIDQPPAGSYSVDVHNYRRRNHEGKVPFRCQLKLPTETLDYEGALGHNDRVTCFRFTVDEMGSITLGSIPLSRIMKKPTTLIVVRPPMKIAKSKKSCKGCHSHESHES